MPVTTEQLNAMRIDSLACGINVIIFKRPDKFQKRRSEDLSCCLVNSSQTITQACDSKYIFKFNF